MPEERKHGAQSYFIEGEGVVGERRRRGPNDDPTDTSRLFRFTRLFGHLPALQASDTALEALGLAMADNGASGDHPTLTAGFTYLGQFIDHDLTLDKTAGFPAGSLDPVTIEQGRSPSLDLDCLYGLGPAHNASLFEADGVHLRVGSTAPLPGLVPNAFPNDLPRKGGAESDKRTAVIGDPRNDENLAVAQTHLAFIKFHNKIVDLVKAANPALSGAALFAAAQQKAIEHYQGIVLHDFLPKVVEPAILNSVVTNGPQHFPQSGTVHPPMPVEFSVAAYRTGHSMVRKEYEWNRFFSSGGQFGIARLTQLFQFTGLSTATSEPGGVMLGFDVLPGNWIVDWTRLYDFEGIGGQPANSQLNFTRLFDTLLVEPLASLPLGIIDAGQPASLAVRNLLRSKRLNLPSGQSVAVELGIPVMSPKTIAKGHQRAIIEANGFDTATPLWYYILREAEVEHGGIRLGPVGSTVVAETFVGIMRKSKHSILGRAIPWVPDLPTTTPGAFKMVDLLTLVNELNPLGN